MLDRHEEPEAISAYLDGEVDGAERARIEEHLGACPRCAGQKAALERAALGVASLPGPSLTPDETRAIRLAVLEAVRPSPRPSSHLSPRPSPRPSPRWAPWRARLWAAAGAMAVLAAGIVGYASLRPRPQPELAGGRNQAEVAAAGSGILAFSSEEQLRQAVVSDPEVTRSLGLYKVGDAEQRSILFSPEEAGTADSSRGLESAPAARPDPLQPEPKGRLAELPASECVQRILFIETQPLLLLQTRPATFKEEPVWLLLFAASSSPDQQAPLDRVDARLVTRTDCSLRARYSQIDSQPR